MFNNFTETELAQERWKDIEDYDGAYQISDLGRVRSCKYGYWRIRRPGKDGNGYLYINLCKDRNIKNVKIHRLVARYFVKNDNIFNSEINHKDENKENNRASNLEWCDRKYNLTYNDIHHRRKYPRQFNCKRRKLEEIYDPNLSIKQNIELFKENGISCSRNTVIRLRKDLGLIN